MQEEHQVQCAYPLFLRVLRDVLICVLPGQVSRYGRQRYVLTVALLDMHVDPFSVGSFRRLNPNYEMPVVKSEMPVYNPGPDQYGNYPPTPPPMPYNPSALCFLSCSSLISS